MINEIKEILQNVKAQRPVKDEATIYGNYTTMTKEAFYDDKEQRYIVRDNLKTCEEVSTVQSFSDFIKEELKRRDKATGKLATAVIDKLGGDFTADDDFQVGRCEFRRSLSQQWIMFKDSLGKTFDHESFLRFLQALSPSIVDFKELYPDFLDIRVIGRAETVSKPFFVNGEQENGIKLKFKMRGGEDESIVLPDTFKVRLPYAKGNYDKLYEIDVNLVYDNRCGVNILVQAPTFEMVEEQALLDEVTFLKEELKQYPDLLVLFNF